MSEYDALKRTLRDNMHAYVEICATAADAIEAQTARIAELEEQVLTVLRREAEATERHDARLESAEAKVARLTKALTRQVDNMANILRHGLSPNSYYKLHG